MIKSYQGNNVYELTLSTGKEIILTTEELDEIAHETPSVTEKIEKLESKVDSVTVSRDRHKEKVESLENSISNYKAVLTEISTIIESINFRDSTEAINLVKDAVKKI